MFHDQPSHLTPSIEELAFTLSVLERQFNAYTRLHEEDLVSVRTSLADLRVRILALQDKPAQPLPDLS